ncbi:hypothetical protein AVEN_162068-1 [Araneus ventricosus]|uniref:Uncharacterized protein n=1 Tax=Araneus ventricosus TaxID=182803 RepID=A0A4Y2L5K2_ARAVE|nr:hypothetical protein AVEN_162068-1 [Araneus ventricosus]
MASAFEKVKIHLFFSFHLVQDKVQKRFILKKKGWQRRLVPATNLLKQKSENTFLRNNGQSVEDGHCNRRNSSGELRKVFENRLVVTDKRRILLHCPSGPFDPGKNLLSSFLAC